jgi:membrane-bound ClpP family serine protease
LLALLGALTLSAIGQSPAPSPAPPTAAPPSAAPPRSGLVSPNVAIIEIKGQIDEITLSSLQRRLRAAEAAGADAVVLDIDTPGGRLDATRAICAELKKTPIKRTIAWVNPDALSAGAIIALACREIVVAPASTFGDAAPIAANPLLGIKSLGAEERSKILAPLVAELADSARRHGWDEKLVQGFAARGAELWLVENTTTGQRLFVDRQEYQLLFGSEPSVGATPAVASPSDAPPAPPIPPDSLARSARPSGAAAEPKTDLPLAVPVQREDLDQINRQLAIASPVSTRPVLTAKDAGQWKLITFATDGRTILTLREDQMLAFGLASAVVANEADLKAYTSASQVGRQSMAWFEYAARWLSHPIVRGVLVVLIILGIFVELVHPGLIAPGAIAGLAIIGLLLPAMLTGLAGWWELIAIVAGILLLLVEIFVLPGFGVAGASGLLLLFGGLVMAFIPAESSLPFADPSARWRGLQYGLVSVFIGVVTTGVVLYYLSKHLPSLPIFGRLVLQERAPDGTIAPETPAVVANVASTLVNIGDVGTCLTPLRPSGKAEFAGQVLDVYADSAFMDAGAKVRVISTSDFRVLVEPA